MIKPHDPNAAVTITLWEAACCNRGLDVKVFCDRESALEWLIATEATTPPLGVV